MSPLRHSEILRLDPVTSPERLSGSPQHRVTHGPAYPALEGAVSRPRPWAQRTPLSHRAARRSSRHGAAGPLRAVPHLPLVVAPAQTRDTFQGVSGPPAREPWQAPGPSRSSGLGRGLPSCGRGLDAASVMGHAISQVRCGFLSPNKQNRFPSVRSLTPGEGQLPPTVHGCARGSDPRGLGGVFSDRDGPRGAHCGLWLGPGFTPGKRQRPRCHSQIVDVGCRTRSGPRFQRLLETRGGWDDAGPPGWPPDTWGRAGSCYPPASAQDLERQEVSEVGAVGDRAEGPCPDAPVGP